MYFSLNISTYLRCEVILFRVETEQFFNSHVIKVIIKAVDLLRPSWGSEGVHKNMLSHVGIVKRYS